MAFVDPLSDPSPFYTPPAQISSPTQSINNPTDFSEFDSYGRITGGFEEHSSNDEPSEDLLTENAPEPPPKNDMEASFVGSSSSLDYDFRATSNSTQSPTETKAPQVPVFTSAIDRAIFSLPSTDFMPLTSSVPSTIIPEPVIKLMSAEKNHDSTGSFTTYLIHTEIPSFHIDLETKHRYSEFEAFQKYLVRSYPTVVVPPIPEKHTISDYATKQGKAKDDPVTIDKRKRMLETFLNRVAIHPVLRRDVVFHKFLEPGISWHEALTNAPLPASLINKNKSALQKLTEPRTLRNPDRQFGAAEDYTLRFSSRTSHALNVERRLVKLTQESSQTYSELGATFNAWSLSEKDLSEAIDQVGQAFDSMSTVTNQLAQAMEERMTDPLQEYVLFSKVIEKLLNWRHDRHVEFEVVTETIHNKKKTLQKLEASELEAQRLAAALRAEGTLGHRQHLPPPSISNEVPGENRGQVNQSSNIPANTFSEYYRPAITPRPQGFLATINSLIDNDPEVTRRNTISKTRVNLVSLEEQRKIALKDLQTANSEIQEDLDRFQSRKIVDFRNLFLSYAMAMKEYHRRSVLAWEEAKSAVDQISLQ